MVFLTMYANGLVSFAVLLVISISQDGYGSLPLFSVSTKSFLLFKLINVLVALVIGFIFLSIVS